MSAFVVVLLLLATSALAFESKIIPAVKIVPAVTVLPINSSSNSSSLPLVHGWKNCDGVNGTVFAFRIQGCDPDTTCEAPAEVVLNTELDAIPSRDIRELGMRIKIVPNERWGSPIPFLNMPFSNTAVEAGTLYRLFASGMATQEYKGQLINVQYSYFDVDSGIDEFCAQAFFHVV